MNMTAPLRIACIGECMVELAPMPGGGFAMGFAGDVFNTAWYLKQTVGYQVAVDFVSAVGTDDLSQQMVDFIGAAGVGTGHIVRLAGATVGLYMIRLDGAERHFTYWRGQSAARAMMSDPARILSAIGDADMVYLSGITLAILPPADRTGLLSALRQSGVPVAFDPNLRPVLWPDLASMCAAVTEAAGLAQIVLPSFEDEARFFGDADPAATVRRYGQGRTVLVKNGAGDMLLSVNGGTTRLAPARPDRIVDTTAAGDSFNAGFLGALLTGASAKDAAHKGATRAARVIGAPGALVAP
jgi:2-dehydro-3-deoxygluconokinase